MNTQTGDIFQGDEIARAINFGIPLVQAEAVELRKLDNVQERLRRYKQSHRNDVCPALDCGRTLRHHSLAEWQHCASKASHGELVGGGPLSLSPVKSIGASVFTSTTAA